MEPNFSGNEWKQAGSTDTQSERKIINCIETKQIDESSKVCIGGVG